MTTSEQFREYAKEAIGWSNNAKTDGEKRALILLANTWTSAALYRERRFLGRPEHDLAA
jgi:hypothetical protein